MRVIAFYLPQFHPIPENDNWWGAGFTEWSNVTSAASLFQGHRQPRLPAELGFYDLRVPEARKAQASLASQFGLHGFCYYHYWFEGKRLLERPFDEVLASGEPDFPFCLCWANESWSRRWLGEEKDILQPQTYSLVDDAEHARWLAQTFADDRYIRVGDRPLFLIYRPNDLPRPNKTLRMFREVCVAAGVGAPYFIGINAHCWNKDCRTLGFDNTLQFMPQLGNLSDFMDDGPSQQRRRHNRQLGIDSDRLKLYDYAGSVESMLANRRKHAHSVIPSMFVGWDNTPRRGDKAIVLINRTPQVFARYLEEVVSERDPANEGLVFVNAWNEWGEGNYLEPDEEFGLGFLKALEGVIKRYQSPAPS